MLVLALVREIFLDDVTLVAEADDEIVQTMVGIMPHDVPKDGVRANFHHWLRSDLGFFRQARAHSPGKDHHFDGL